MPLRGELRKIRGLTLTLQKVRGNSEREGSARKVNITVTQVSSGYGLLPEVQQKHG
jgi:hypothetical protein